MKNRLSRIARMPADKFTWFMAIVILFKIAVMGSFSSDYQNRLFMPFVESFIQDMGSSNPYDVYYLTGSQSAFPYPPLMLLIESVGGSLLYLLGMIKEEIPFFIENLVFKLPLLLFDFMGLNYMMKLFPHKRKYVAMLYFASPVIVYAIYMHGQLDIIPTALLLGCLYYLVKADGKRNWLAAIFLSMSLLTKLHILAAVPIIFLFLFKRDGMKRTIGFFLIVAMITLFGMLPFMGKGFLRLVLLNSEQTVLTKVYVEFLDVKLYIPILAILMIYLSVFNANIINKDLLLSFCGVMFAVFLALCPPMPGWYVWIVPFITMFFIQEGSNKYKSIFIYLILNGFYLTYFLFFHNKQVVDLYFLHWDLSWMKIMDETAKNIVFTLLSGCLIFIIGLMYQSGVASNTFYKRRGLPFTIGIAGDSGTGKSKFMEILQSILGEHQILFIEGDGDHRWKRGDEEWKDYTHLNPRANYLYRQAMDMQQLRKGIHINRKEYNHETGDFTDYRMIKPKKYIVLCGLHSLYLPQMRKNTDLKIYMDTDEELRRYWKIQRDTSYRAQTQQEVLRQITSRVDDAVKYIYPQKQYADMVVRYFDNTLNNCLDKNHDVNLSFSLTLSVAVDIEPIIEQLSQYGVEAIYDYSNDLKNQIVTFTGTTVKNAEIPFERIIKSGIPQIEEITREYFRFENNMQGIIAIFLMELISFKMKGEE